MSPHPSCPPGAVRAIEVRARREADSLTLDFRLEGALDRVVVPPVCPPERRDELWRHTCFEAFVRCAGEAAYLELNVAPSGAWAAYRFESYRDGLYALDVPHPPAAEVQRHRGRLEVAIHITLPEPWGRAEVLRAGVCAVVEDVGGALAYWALAHPAAAPDFHHAAGFTLELG